jgi:hypothetical protein
MQNFRVSFDVDLIKIQCRKLGGWRDMVTDAFFNGQRFVSSTRGFVFEEHGNSSYLIEEVPFRGKNPIAQKCESFPPLNEAWKKRIGKKYIVCDAHPADMILTSGGFSLTIQEYEHEEGLLFFVYTWLSGMNSLPVISAGEWETKMVLNTPLQGSREGFAPFIYEKCGIEYLYAFGYNLIDLVYLEPLQTGQIISEKGRRNKIYSITAGHKLIIDIPTDVRVIILNSDLKQKYDSISGQNINETCDGFIQFINEGSMNVSIEVCS